MVHYWFLVEKIAPAVNLVFDPQRQMIVKQRLEAINWEPYHPDRQEMLESIMAV
jgi:predicted nicotinamide N-methyase